jgi:predicted amidohydrolase
MNSQFRIAVLQQKSAGRNLDQNLSLILSAMKEACQNNADLLLIPECFLNGYEFPISYEDAIPLDHPAIQTICETAKTLHMGIVATAFTKGKQKPQNTAFLIDKNGQVRFAYHKVHTCDFADEASLESGTEFYVGKIDSVSIGVMICYDREYPESARVLMMKGAEIIVLPNDCGSMAPRLNALSTRAYENMTGIVMANPPGDNAGNSCAFSPICWDQDGNCVDNTIFIAGEQDTGLFYADFDLVQLRDYRSREMMGNTFRKVNAYGELMNPERKEPFLRPRQESDSL